MNKKIKPTEESFSIFSYIVLAVLFALIMYAVLITNIISNWSERGQFGDMFGALNAMFSGLAFAALVYTLFLQRKELSLQRAELALTRAELSKQSDAQALQAATALKAARISALGALYQTYGQLASGGKYGYITRGNWDDEITRVRDQLKELLIEEDK